MIRKKLIVLIITLLFIATGGGFYYFKIYKSVKVFDCEGFYLGYDTEKKMYDAADIILYGTPIQKFEDRKYINKYTEDGSLYDYCTITKFKIKKVLKAPFDLNIKKSEIFDVIEPIGVVQEFYGKEILKTEAYEAMEKNDVYIVYLGYNGIGGYSVINMINGRYNLTKDEFLNDSKHIRLKHEVMERFSIYSNGIFNKVMGEGKICLYYRKMGDTYGF